MTRPGWQCNMAEAVCDSPGATSARSAIRFPGGEWSRRDLSERVDAIARGLADRGVGPGLRVALCLPDSPTWIAAFLALARLGAVVALASPTLPAARLADAVSRSGSTLVLTDDEELLPHLDHVDTAMLERFAAVGLPGPDAAPTRASDPCYLLLTSGSTGPAKWAVHRHGDIPACLATYGRHVLRLRPGDVTWSVAVLATSYGLGNSMYFPLGAGASTWITGASPTPAEAARACEEGGANVLFGVPTFWARLARHVARGTLSPATFAGVRLAVSAGEPLPAPVWHAVRAHLGLELVDGLGSSEATNLYLSNLPGRACPGSLGRVVPGYTLRVVDDAGRRLEDGTPGELVVRGPTVMPEYLGDSEATAGALRDGWLHTGDLVVRESDGRYRFVGRLGARFKSGGSWVDPTRVEAVLLEHPGVAEAAVVGAPDASGITRVVAVVAPEHGTQAEDLRSRLEDLASVELAPHEVPRSYVFCDHLPTASSGKVRRGEVARMVAEATRTAAVAG